MSRPLTHLLAASAILTLTAVATADAATKPRIEAVEGKQYRLTKQHGPWMVVVASLSDREGQGESEGKSAQEAADELILELRQIGIPAYAFAMEKSSRVLQSAGGRQSRIEAGGQISVLAGNFSGPTDDAQKTMKWIKSYFPKCLAEGGVWQQTPGRPGPLSGAFLSVNPLLSPDEVITLAKRTPDGRRAIADREKLLRKLNAGNRYPLSSVRGSHSLCVARFEGKSVTVAQNEEVALLDFLSDNDLDESGLMARDLCEAMRQHGYEAYLWHDQFRSVVTIGSFNGPGDSRINAFRKRFARDFQTDEDGNLIAAPFARLGGFGEKGDVERIWPLLASPQPIEVPFAD